MVNTFCEKFLLKMRERHAVYSSRMLNGALTSFDEYKFISGKLMALQESESLLKQVYKDMFDSRKLETRSEVNDDVKNEFY